MFLGKLFKTLSLIWLTFMLLTLWGCQPLQNHENYQEIEKTKHLCSLKVQGSEWRLPDLPDT